MGRLRTKAAQCQYKEHDSLLTKQFINGINDDGMQDEILKEVATLDNIEDTTSEHVLLGACRVEVQRVQKSALHDINEAKEFDIIKQHTKKQVQNTPKVDKRKDS